MRVNVYSPSEDGYGTIRSHFDWSKASRWSDVDYNGNGSGGAGRGQAVMLTSGGRWVLEHWTHWQNEQDRYEYITAEDAREWLLANGDDDAVAEHLGEVPEEEDRRPGRPEVGGAVHVRLGDLLAAVDAYAAGRSTGRADAIRHLITQGLATETTVI